MPEEPPGVSKKIFKPMFDIPARPRILAGGRVLAWRGHRGRRHPQSG